MEIKDIKFRKEEEIQNPRCNVCGANTQLEYIKSSGMDITPVGLFATCIRCGNKQKVKALNEK